MKTRIILHRNTVEFRIMPPRKATPAVMANFNKALKILNARGKKTKNTVSEIRISVPI